MVPEKDVLLLDLLSPVGESVGAVDNAAAPRNTGSK